MMILQQLYELRPVLYALLFVGMMIEGEAILFTAILLVSRHVLDPVMVVITSLSGLFIGDFLWYFVGLRLLPRFPRLGKAVNRITRSFNRLLQHKPFRLIFVSKFIYGIHHAVLIKAGSMGMKLRQYAKLIIVVDLLWYTIIITAGSLFSQSIGHFKHYLKYTEILFLLAVVVFIVIEQTISNLSERAFERSELDETKP